MHPIELNQLLSDMYCITQELLRRPMTVEQLSKETNIPQYSVRVALGQLMAHKHIYHHYSVWKHRSMTQYAIWESERRAA